MPYDSQSIPLMESSVTVLYEQGCPYNAMPWHHVAPISAK